MPIYQEPNTSKKHPAHKIYPYLLKGLAITRPNQVWCADITYIRMERGFLYLVAIMDWKVSGNGWPITTPSGPTRPTAS